MSGLQLRDHGAAFGCYPLPYKLRVAGARDNCGVSIGSFGSYSWGFGQLEHRRPSYRLSLRLIIYRLPLSRRNDKLSGEEASQAYPAARGSAVAPKSARLCAA